MLIIVQARMCLCAPGCVHSSDLVLSMCTRTGSHVYVCVFRRAELDLGSEARKGRDAWRNLAMRLINSLATQSRFIK